MIKMIIKIKYKQNNGEIYNGKKLRKIIIKIMKE